MRVAFATNDMKTMDAHFAGARNMVVYSVTEDESQLVEVARFDDTSKEDGRHAEPDEDRITPRVEAIAGCALLFVLAIGGPAAAKVVNHRIHPIKLPQAEPIEAILARVQAMLKTSPPPWLRKAMGVKSAKQLDFIDDGVEERA
ncbi:MAG: nitrogen fixation protein NifX [Rhodospirillales bacterium]|nr:nitrogen fixation protein NifX [Rhodospirillales bacterium]